MGEIPDGPLGQSGQCAQDPAMVEWLNSSDDVMLLKDVEEIPFGTKSATCRLVYS